MGEREHSQPYQVSHKAVFGLLKLESQPSEPPLAYSSCMWVTLMLGERAVGWGVRAVIYWHWDLGRDL